MGQRAAAAPAAGGKGKQTAALAGGSGRDGGERTPSRMERGINAALLVTVDEACRMLGVGRKGIYTLMSRGEIEYRHIGRFRRIPVWSLEDFAGVPEHKRYGAGSVA